MNDEKAAEYGIAELARASGVSSRTLRHYDAIGLLTPASTGANGYRFYDQGSVLRLQRVLLLRELGLSLETIAAVLDGGTDARSALVVHAKWLDAERKRLAAMAATVRATLTHLESGEAMTPTQAFDGFGPNPYEAEARERWGDRAVDDSAARLRALGKDGQRALLREHEAIANALFAAVGDGLSADDPAVQAIVAKHHAWVRQSWTPSAEAYRGLGEMYLSDSRFTASYDAPKGAAPRPGVTALLSAAMAHYALASPEHFDAAPRRGTHLDA